MTNRFQDRLRHYRWAQAYMQRRALNEGLQDFPINTFGRNVIGGTSPTSPLAQSLVTNWSSSGDGMALVFETAPSIYVKDSTTPANDTNLKLASDGIGTFSDYLTHTNPDPKIVRQSDGFYKHAAHNLAATSNDFDSASFVPSQLTVTPDVISDPQGGVTGSSLIPSAVLTDHVVSQSIAHDSGTYRMACWFRPNGYERVALRSFATSSPIVTFVLSGSGSVLASTGASSSSITKDGDWYLCEMIYENTSAGNKSCSIYVHDNSTSQTVDYSGDGVSGIYAYGFHLHAHPADETYLPTTAARYALPIQYDASGVAEGLLVEPQATNLINNSYNRTGTPSWGIGGSASQSQDQTGISGIADTAWSYTGTASASDNISCGLRTVTADTWYCFSLYVKKISGVSNWVMLETRWATTAAGRVLCWFDIANGTKGTSSVTAGTATAQLDSYDIEEIVVDGESWYRIWIISKTTTSIVWGGFFWIVDGDGSQTVVAGSVANDNIQLESSASGGRPTSPIITNGATVTRDKDQISKVTSALPFSTEHGSLYLKATNLNSNNRTVVFTKTASPGTHDAGGFVSSTGASWPLNNSELQMIVAGVANGTTFKMASGYAPDDGALSLDGDTVDVDNSGSVDWLSGVGGMHIGANRNFGSIAHILIKEIAYYPERLRNEYLEAITAGNTVTLWTDSEAQYWVNGETDALSLDFTDDYFQSTTGYYGSAYVLDSGTPANDYDSSPDGLLDVGGNTMEKMVLGPNGTLQYQPHNFLPYSDDLNTSGWGDDQLGSRVTGISDPKGGTSAVHLIEDSTAGSRHESRNGTTTTVVGQKYRVSIYAKEPASNSRRYFTLYCNGGSSNRYATFDLENGTVVGGSQNISEDINSVGDGWYLCEYVFECTNTREGNAITYVLLSDNNNERLPQYDGGGVLGLYFYGAHVHTYPANTTYVPTTTTAKFGLAYDWYTSGTQRGILVEPEATNLLSTSLPDDGTIWTENATAATPNSAAGPSGLTDATLVQSVAGTTTHSILLNYSCPAAVTSFAMSFYLKQGTTQYALVGSGGAAPAISVAYVVDLSDGTVAQTLIAGDSTPDIEDAGNGWYRVTIFDTSDGDSGSPSFYCGPHDGSGAASYAAVGNETIYVWHCQVETGSVPTSLIQTFGTTATRDADDITLATIDFNYSSLTDSFYVEYTRKISNEGGNVLDGQIGGGGERIYLQIDASNNIEMQLAPPAGNQLAPLDSTVNQSVNTVTRVAGALATDDVALSAGGTTAQTDGSAIMPSPSIIRFMLHYAAANAVNGHLRRFIWLPRRVSNADLEDWTNTGDLP